MNLHRRDLTSSQKATVAVDVEKLLADEAKERQRAAGVERAKSAEREPKTGQVKKSQLPELIPEAGAGSFTFTCPSCHQQYTKVSGHVCKEAARANESRKQAAKIVGTNPRYVSDANKVAVHFPFRFPFTGFAPSAGAGTGTGGSGGTSTGCGGGGGLSM